MAACPPSPVPLSCDRTWPLSLQRELDHKDAECNASHKWQQSSSGGVSLKSISYSELLLYNGFIMEPLKWAQTLRLRLAKSLSTDRVKHRAGRHCKPLCVILEAKVVCALPRQKESLCWGSSVRSPITPTGSGYNPWRNGQWQETWARAVDIAEIVLGQVEKGALSEFKGMPGGLGRGQAAAPVFMKDPSSISVSGSPRGCSWHSRRS